MQVAVKKTDFWGAVTHTPQVCASTHTTLSFPTHPSVKSPYSGIFRATPQLFFLHSVARFTFGPGQSGCVFDGENLASLTIGLCYKAVLLAPGEVVSACAHQRSQGPLVNAPVSKKNVKPLELVILLNDINTHSKRFHCCCL